MRAFRIALLLLVVALLRQPAWAQPVTGSVAGSVSASTGIGLPGATVTIVGDGAAIERTAATGADGEYRLDGLPLGATYELRAELDGFAPVSRTGIRLTPGGRDTVSFLLMAVTSETLSITARTASREQQRLSVQQTIPERLAHSVPLVGRDFIALASLTPGFTGNPVAPSPNGQIYWANNILVDGASHFSKWRSAARTFYSGYSLEAIQDVQVQNSRFTPEFGATMGGPVTRDRTFFFANYEGRRARSNNIVVSPAAPQAPVPNNEDEHLVFLKIDHRVSSNDLLSVRYNGQTFSWLNETGGLWLPGSGAQYRNDVHTLLVTATQLVSTHILNQARFQVARYTDRRTDLQPSVYVSRAGYSIEGATLGPYGFGATPEDTYEGADTLTHNDGAHSVKMGTGFKYVRAHNESLPFGRGAYYFAGPPSLYPQPYAFVQGLTRDAGVPDADPRSISSFFFVQDEWRILPRLAINFGARYDIERIQNVSGYGAAADRNNLQPRVSALWTPFGGAFGVRGGAGLYTQQHLLYYANRAEMEGPEGAASVTLTQGSPLMPVYPAVLSSAVLSQVPRDVYVVDPAFRNPFAVQAALGVQHQLLGFDVAADFIYLDGHALMSLVDANAPASVDKPVFRSVALADGTRPAVPAAGGYRKILSLGNEGRSWYRGLQVKVDSLPVGVPACERRRRQRHPNLSLVVGH